MAIAPKSKTPVKTPAKPTAETPAKPSKAPQKPEKTVKGAKPEKAQKPQKAPKTEQSQERGTTRNGLVVEMLLEKKFTDKQIKEAVNAKFAPLTLNPAAIPVARANLNKTLSEPIERLVEIDGKVMPKSEAPAKEKGATRKKVDPDNDPLRKIGVKVSEKPKAAAKPRVATPKK